MAARWTAVDKHRGSISIFLWGVRGEGARAQLIARRDRIRTIYATSIIEMTCEMQCRPVHTLPL